MIYAFLVSVSQSLYNNVIKILERSTKTSSKSPVQKKQWADTMPTHEPAPLPSRDVEWLDSNARPECHSHTFLGRVPSPHTARRKNTSETNHACSWQPVWNASGKNKTNWQPVRNVSGKNRNKFTACVKHMRTNGRAQSLFFKTLLNCQPYFTVRKCQIIKYS